MANELVQAGTAVEVGFQGLTMPGSLLLEGNSPSTLKLGYDQRDQSLDTNGNVRTKLRAGAFESYQVKLEIPQDTPANPISFIEGDVIQITPASGGLGAYFEWQEDVQTELSWNKVIVTGTLKKEDTMDYTPA
jgi:hypothetical protein